MPAFQHFQETYSPINRALTIFTPSIAILGTLFLVFTQFLWPDRQRLLTTHL